MKPECRHKWCGTCNPQPRATPEQLAAIVVPRIPTDLSPEAAKALRKKMRRVCGHSLIDGQLPPPSQFHDGGYSYSNIVGIYENIRKFLDSLTISPT